MTHVNFTTTFYSRDCEGLLRLANQINSNLPFERYIQKIKEIKRRTFAYVAAVNHADPRQVFFARRVQALATRLAPNQMTRFSKCVKKLERAKMSRNGRFKEQGVFHRENGCLKLSLQQGKCEFLRCYAENTRLIGRDQVDALMRWGIQNWDPIIIKRLLSHRRFSREFLDHLIQTATSHSTSPPWHLRSIASPLMLHHYHSLSEEARKRVCDLLEVEPAPQGRSLVFDTEAPTEESNMELEVDPFKGFVSTSAPTSAQVTDSEKLTFEETIQSLFYLDEPGTFNEYLNPNKMRALPEAVRDELFEWADENEDVELLQFLVQHDLISKDNLNAMVEASLDLGLFKDIASAVIPDKIKYLKPTIQKQVLSWQNSVPH